MNRTKLALTLVAAAVITPGVQRAFAQGANGNTNETKQIAPNNTGKNKRDAKLDQPTARAPIPHRQGLAA